MTMLKYNKQLHMKVILILLAEALAILITDFVSANIIPIEHTTISYIVCGAILAFAVVSSYDYIIRRGAMRAQQERQELINTAMLRYSTKHRDHR
ncbi:hypothetical protein [Bacillus phage BC-T25]|nr:hypothetical protein [Bacillus phage BC-T25]